MGIINVTPDSFFEKTPEVEEAVTKALQMNVDIIDIGGESTRPGSQPVSEEEELRRVLPVLSRLKTKTPLSIDTSKPRVAEEALKRGCSIINDVTGLEDPRMRELAARTEADVIIMHNQPMAGVDSLLRWFEERLALVREAGIKDEKIIIDPGIGFAKTAAQNYEVLKGIPRLKTLGFPLLIGLSRKSFLKKSLAGTIAANTYALLTGADIVRVHDIEEARAMIDFLANIQAIQ